MQPQEIPAYVINLDRRPDRWETISRNLDRIGVTAERIPAVDARLLADREERRIERGDGRSWRISLGSAAGMQGHAKAMRRLLESDAPAALILEDDAELAQDTASLLQSVAWWPDEATVVRLELTYPAGRRWLMSAPLWRPSGKTPSGRDLRRLERWAAGSAAYLINREGSVIVLEAFADPDHTVDHTLFDLRVSETARRLHTVQVIPAMARQRQEDESDQDAWRKKRKTATSVSARRRQHLRRNLSSLPYKTRLRFLMLLGLVSKVEIAYRAQARD